jgi:D-alanine--poly(phosphoribitol) ligase subunit 1
MSQTFQHSLRERLVEKFLNNPDGCAFEFPGSDGKVSNQEALSIAVSIGIYLEGLDLVQGDIVAILHDQSRDAYLAQLALFLHGVPYVIVDQESPYERISRIHLKVGFKVMLVFGRGNLSHALPAPTASLCVDALPLVEVPENPIFPRVLCTDLAYLVLTSGSTGEPKAVGITHLNLLCFVHWALETFALGPEDVFASLNPPHFDNAVFDFFCSQASGGSLFIIATANLQDPKLLPALLEESASTVWFSVPSLIIFLMKTKVLTLESISGIRKILFGGEGFPMKHLEKLWNLTRPGKTRLWNVYGPSECACMCSAYELGGDDINLTHDLPPIGYISPMFRFSLEQPDKRGVGELLLVGPQVGPGYLGDKVASKKAFPEFEEGTSGLLTRGYLTGDFMRLDSDGLLRFVGRKDSQVKIMGRRIELTEIESEILGLERCTEAFVGVVQGPTELPVLSAWIATSESPEFIHRELKKVLPAYMIPKSIITLRELPKNRNGKIDRQALKSGPI